MEYLCGAVRLLQLLFFILMDVPFHWEDKSWKYEVSLIAFVQKHIP